MTMLAIDGLLMPEKVGSAPLDAALRTLVAGLEAPAARHYLHIVGILSRERIGRGKVWIGQGFPFEP